MKYRIDLVWNREFNWAHYRDSDDLEEAKRLAKDIRDSGDGARVKKIKITDSETDKVVWQS